MMDVSDFSNAPCPCPQSASATFIKTDHDEYTWDYFREEYTGVAFLKNAKNDCLLLVSPRCYVKKIHNAVFLLWYEDNDSKSIHIYLLDLSLMRKIELPLEVARRMRREREFLFMNSSVGILDEMQVPRSREGQQKVAVPERMRDLDEVLVLSEFIPSSDGYFDHYYWADAIYAVNFREQEVNVYPQDWHNRLNLDFGHNTVLQVKRNADGSMSVRGAGFAPFQLDETFRWPK